jgi:hypothetical protein
MAYERRLGDVVIFYNNKRSSDKSPQYTGKILSLDGQELEISLWEKLDKNENRFFTGKISLPFSGPKKVNSEEFNNKPDFNNIEPWDK